MSDGSDVMEELAAELLCPVCREGYHTKRPKVLPCNHVFCADCITSCLSWHWMLDYRLSCPLCRTEHTFENKSSVSRLPEPLIIKQLQETVQDFLSAHAASGSDGKKCSLCKGSHAHDATSFCLTCVRNLCDACAEKHSQNVFFKGHNLVTISNTTSCSAHQGELVIAFCKSCDHGVCIQCGNSSSHDRHDIVDMKDKTLVKEKFAKLREFKADCKNQNRSLKRHIDDVRKSGNRLVTSDISMEGWLDDFHTKVFNMTVAYHQGIKIKIMAEQAKLDKHVYDIEKLEESGKSVISTIDRLVKRKQYNEMILLASDLPDLAVNSVPVLPTLTYPGGGDKLAFLDHVMELLECERAAVLQEEQESNVQEEGLRKLREKQQKEQRRRQKQTQEHERSQQKDNEASGQKSNDMAGGESKDKQGASDVMLRSLTEGTPDVMMRSLTEFAGGTLKGLYSFMGSRGKKGDGGQTEGGTKTTPGNSSGSEILHGEVVKETKPFKQEKEHLQYEDGVHSSTESQKETIVKVTKTAKQETGHFQAQVNETLSEKVEAELPDTQISKIKIQHQQENKIGQNAGDSETKFQYTEDESNTALDLPGGFEDKGIDFNEQRHQLEIDLELNQNEEALDGTCGLIETSSSEHDEDGSAHAQTVVCKVVTVEEELSLRDILPNEEKK